MFCFCFFKNGDVKDDQELYSNPPATLIGTPLHILIHDFIKSGSHVAAAQGIKSFRYRSRSAFKRGENVTLTMACFFGGFFWCRGISKAADHGFSDITICRVYTERCGKISGARLNCTFGQRDQNM